MTLHSIGQVRATMLRPGMCNSSVFNTECVATRRNSVTKRAQHVAPDNDAIGHVEMFRSFDRALRYSPGYL